MIFAAAAVVVSVVFVVVVVVWGMSTDSELCDVVAVSRVWAEQACSSVSVRGDSAGETARNKGFAVVAVVVVATGTVAALVSVRHSVTYKRSQPGQEKRRESRPQRDCCCCQQRQRCAV